MIYTRPEDTYHKIQLFRLLTEIADTPELARALRFKGGTAASMLGYLDRFSVDLDFDLMPGGDAKALRRQFHGAFGRLGLRVDDQSKRALSFLVKYERPAGQRNTINVDALDRTWSANRYETRKLAEIDRMFVCQTRETIVSNKLVAPLDRWKAHRSVAGRDFYDIHYFLSHGYRYIPEIIRERTGYRERQFFLALISFMKKYVTERIITEDLNTLLTPRVFQAVRKTLIAETLTLLEGETVRFA